jgi:hypothetical protein
LARYFKYFPKTYYFSHLDPSSLDVVTNILTRFKFEEGFKNNSVFYYEYDIQDGDTPEIIAAKIYDSPEKHWAVLMINDIVDPLWDWPLDQRTIIKFIDEKYSANATGTQTGTQWAKINTKQYLIVETKTIAGEDSVIVKYETDSSTYANTSTYTITKTLSDGKLLTIGLTKETKSYYDYEIEENEKKRTIKLLRPEFVAPLDREIKRLSSGN